MGEAEGPPERRSIAAAAEMADKLPEVMDEEATAMAFPVDYNESMNTLLCQEQVKFNKLLRVMKHTLFNVQRALKGLLVMSSDLETVANAIFTQDMFFEYTLCKYKIVFYI